MSCKEEVERKSTLGALEFSEPSSFSGGPRTLAAADCIKPSSVSQRLAKPQLDQLVPVHARAAAVNQNELVELGSAISQDIFASTYETKPVNQGSTFIPGIAKKGQSSRFRNERRQVDDLAE